MKTFRFTQYEIHGQEVAVDANSEAEAREKVLNGDGRTVNQPFYVRTAEDIELELNDSD